MRISLGVLLACSAVAVVGAQQPEATSINRIGNGQVPPRPTLTALANAVGSLIPGQSRNGNLISIALPSPLVSYLNQGKSGLRPGLSKASSALAPAPKPTAGSSVANSNNAPSRGKEVVGSNVMPPAISDPREQIKCTTQEVDCDFLQTQAYTLQNDDDECLRLAHSFDTQGNLDIEPLAESADTVVFGITTDGLTASAWCNDIGWTLRRIYAKCRKTNNNKCYGGQGYAARSTAYMVSVGPKVSGGRVVNRVVSDGGREPSYQVHGKSIDFFDTTAVGR